MRQSLPTGNLNGIAAECGTSKARHHDHYESKEAVADLDLKIAMAHTRWSMEPVFGHVFIDEHCLRFDVSLAHEAAKGIKNPRTKTADCDKKMWAALQG